MAVWKRVNYAFKEPPFQEGDVVERGNYSQAVPNTEICKNVRNLTINGGNFCNCKPQRSWVINGGNWCQKEFCTHNHHDRAVQHGLPLCAEDCSHRKGAVKQWVDVHEDEYREEKNSLSPTKPRVKINESEDADGIKTQEFQKEIYVYEDTVTATGPQVLAARGVHL